MRKLLETGWLLGVALLALTGTGNGESLKDEIQKMGPGAMVITSRSLELNDATGVVTFTGEVRAEKGDIIIECSQMRVYYAGSGGQEATEEVETRIHRIVATGDVRIQRGQGGVATAQKAVYYQKDEKAVLTGNPVVKQGMDFVEGERITIYLQENRSVVEGSKTSKVRAVIFPKRKR